MVFFWDLCIVVGEIVVEVVVVDKNLYYNVVDLLQCDLCCDVVVIN